MTRGFLCSFCLSTEPGGSRKVTEHTLHGIPAAVSAGRLGWVGSWLRGQLCVGWEAPRVQARAGRLVLLGCTTSQQGVMRRLSPWGTGSGERGLCQLQRVLWVRGGTATDPDRLALWPSRCSRPSPADLEATPPSSCPRVHSAGSGTPCGPDSQ